MDDLTILPVKPGTLSDADKAALREGGVITIEHERPEELRLLRPTADLAPGEMLSCAMHALAGSTCSSQTRAEFTLAVYRLLEAKRVGHNA